MSRQLANIWRSTALRVTLLVAAGALAGYLIRGGGRGPESVATHEHAGQEQESVEFWTCSMHPQIRQPKPGQCPICGMDLIPVTSGDSSEELGPRQLKLSPAAVKLAQIQTAPVERRLTEAEIRMVGKIEFDESQLRTITAWVPGRLDRLFVDYTGISVRKGDHLVYLYSPELLSAQEELIQSLQAVQDLKNSGLASMRETALKTVDAVREKLRLWGLTPTQIEAIERNGKSSDHLTIYAPISGIVIHKNAVEGMYVDTGTRIYTIGDLSQLWVKLDSYESDLAWIRYGQAVEFQTETYPGEVFKGTIAFIDPVLDAKTRTVKVRVNVDNRDGRLKPEMFVRAVVRTTIASGGKVVDPTLAGKWICPMHPEVVKKRPGSCDVCEMPLVTTESLGYTSVDASTSEAPLTIPASAPLVTGTRSVVYVAVDGKDGVFEGREIVLGPRTGDHYIVREGLLEGERVVVNGNFKLDSAVQILAKPSMMNPQGGGPAPGHQHGGAPGAAATQPAEAGREAYDVPEQFRQQMEAVLTAYFEIQQALSRDDPETAKAAAGKLLKALERVDMGLVKGAAHEAWMKHARSLRQESEGIRGSKDVAGSRRSFFALSNALIEVAASFGSSGRQPVLRYHCPMAFDGQGADWLQNKEGTENPYYGSAMFRCGSQEEILSPGPLNEHNESHRHE